MRSESGSDIEFLYGPNAERVEAAFGDSIAISPDESRFAE
jgi:hypothetical protein